ncbi:MAG: TrmH family RNA methyltransferase [Lachnospiraceae bacterium]|nr:TrmH family RNA methyltransferase [Lachnospiraceae bacterium]
MAVKPYKKEFDYSYALGAFPTVELIKKRPEQVTEVLLHSTFTDRELITSLCREHNIPVLENDKTIARLSDKENVFVIGVFRKYEDTLAADQPHLMLVNPGNMGNAGTIFRTCLAFGIHDVAIITPGIDRFHPKAVRASMGALFSLRVQCFPDFETYRKQYGTAERKLYSFMLTGKKQLTAENCPKPELFTLIFGNEATGLPEEYADFSESIIIPQSPEVDSLNLTIAVGIGAYLFRKV